MKKVRMVKKDPSRKVIGKGKLKKKAIKRLKGAPKRNGYSRYA